jgi:hypothetical protein
MFLIQYIVEGVTTSLYIHCRIKGEANDIIVSVLEEVLLHEDGRADVRSMHS